MSQRVPSALPTGRPPALPSSRSPSAPELETDGCLGDDEEAEADEWSGWTWNDEDQCYYEDEVEQEFDKEDGGYEDDDESEERVTLQEEDAGQYSPNTPVFSRFSAVWTQVFTDIQQRADEASEAHSEDAHYIPEGYQVVCKIGEGAYANVYKCRASSTGTPVAVKVIDTESLGERLLQSIRNELDVLQLVRGYDCFVHMISFTTSAQHIVITMDLLSGGEMFFSLDTERHSERVAQRCVVQIASAIQILHSLGIAHRDLKPQNLMYSDASLERLVIIDFGFAASGVTRDSRCTEYLGTTHFQSPNIVSMLPYNPLLGDIWALGILTYMLMCGEVPFNHHNRIRLISTIKKCDISFEHPMFRHVSVGAIQFINDILVSDAARRPFVEQVLAHPWLQEQVSDEPFVDFRVKPITKFRGVVKGLLLANALSRSTE